MIRVLFKTTNGHIVGDDFNNIGFESFLGGPDGIDSQGRKYIDPPSWLVYIGTRIYSVSEKMFNALTAIDPKDYRKEILQYSSSEESYVCVGFGPVAGLKDLTHIDDEPTSEVQQ
jgi:hypothetical protein